MPKIGSKRKRQSSSQQIKCQSVKKAKIVAPRPTKLILSADQFSQTKICDVILTCGNSDTGQLAHGEKASATRCAVPTKVQRFEPPVGSFLQIAAGSFHTVVLTADYQVYTSGCNDDCALGRECFKDDNKTKRIDDQDFILRPVISLNEFHASHGHPIQISAGDSHTAVLTSKGSVLIWGTFRDKQGCLGLSIKKCNGHGDVVVKTDRPTVVSSFTERCAVKIVSGFNHVTFLDSHGCVLTLGAGDAGQLGRLAPQFRDGSASYRAKSRMLMPMIVAPERSRSRVFFNDVWCAGYCCFARSIDGSIFVWGLNNYYQLGYVPNDHEQTTLFYPIKSDQFKSTLTWKNFSGDHHIVGLDDKSNLYVIGRGDDSRLGTGENSEQQILSKLDKFDGIPAGIAAGNSCTFVWRKNGTALVWGYDNEGETGLGFEDCEEIEKPTPLKADSLKNVQVAQIAVGGQHTVFLAKSN